jgi:lipopolysaccharide biosynthesis glycosyltransferase
MIHICCAAERNYIAHSAAMLVSAARNRGENALHIHYLHGPRFPRRAQSRLDRCLHSLGATISFSEILDEAVAGLATRGFTRKATWYRIRLPELLPDVERTLYLDVDTIVLSDLTPLWETDLGDNYLAAVTNIFQPNDVSRAAKLGIKPSSYFNAGVLLMNLELMRREGASQAVYRFATQNPVQVSWRDQDALNLVLGARRLPLHPRWNCMHAVLAFPAAVKVFGPEAVAEARRDPAIRHFEGPGWNKPWHVDYEGRDRDLYLRYRRQTPWPRVRLEGRRPRDRAARVIERLWPELERWRGRLGRARRRLVERMP